MTVPATHALVRAGRVRAAIRRDLVAALAPWMLAPEFVAPAGAEPIAGGRGTAFRVTLPGGVRAVVRRYRRGGAIARFVQWSYLGLRPRPLRELAVTEAARGRGVDVPEVLAARVEGGLVYRGAIVTAEIPAARPLLEAVRAAADGAARAAIATAAGRTVAAMHRAGVFHADLNCSNLLVRQASGGPAVAVCDLDRARLARRGLPAPARRMNLRRLRRSLRKLDPAGTVAGAGDVARFHAAYAAAFGEAPCGS